MNARTTSAEAAGTTVNETEGDTLMMRISDQGGQTRLAARDGHREAEASAEASEAEAEAEAAESSLQRTLTERLSWHSRDGIINK